jgi:glutathione S-transferase
MSQPRLYYMPRTRSSRVLWTLEEIGAPYELTEIPGAQRRSPEHLARHPLGRVPALELADGTTIFESAAICLQLADLNPDARLIGPIGSPERARVYQWVLFSMSELEASLYRSIRSDAGAESPELDRFTEAATALEAALGEHDWLLDDRFTVADVMCVSVLASGHTRGLLGDWPRLQAYVERGQARPGYLRAAAIWDRPRT